MKFTVIMKSPESLHRSLEGLSEEDKEEAEAFAQKYMQYGEYLRVEFDTENATAVVLPV